jgi:hypothetical protein
VTRPTTRPQNAYTFHAKFYFYLSWTDPEAPIKQAEATKKVVETEEDCPRLCNGQRAFSATTNKCCAGVWTPNLILRNVMGARRGGRPRGGGARRPAAHPLPAPSPELPEGRTQPYTLSVGADGKVAWRLEVQGVWYTFLNLHAFPLDRQRLNVMLSHTNFNASVAYVAFVASASGRGIFTQASADDAMDSISGWDVSDVFVQVRPLRTFLAQFVTGDSIDYSAAGDPLPINPPLNDSRPLKSLNVAKQVVSSFEVIIDVTRLRANYAFSVLLPVIFISSISWVAFLIDPTGLSLRVSTVLTSLLSLLALQFVIEAKLPNSSYVLPTKQLVLLSYASLALIAFESVAVFELSRWPSLRAARAERKAALDSVAHARKRDAERRGVSAFRAFFAGPPSAAALSHLHSARSRLSLRRDTTFGVHIKGDCPDGDPRHNANGGIRGDTAPPGVRRQSSAGDPRHSANGGIRGDTAPPGGRLQSSAGEGRGHALAKDADGPDGGTATGRRLEAAYYRALAHTVDLCTFAVVAIAYTLSVVGILLGGLTNQSAVRRPGPTPHAARAVPLPPLPGLAAGKAP